LVPCWYLHEWIRIDASHEIRATAATVAIIAFLELLFFKDEVIVQLVHRAGEAADDLAQRRNATLINTLFVKHCPTQVEQGTLWHKYLTETTVEAARSTTVIGQTGVLLQGPLRSTLAPQCSAKEAALISTFLGITAAVAKTGGPFVGRVVSSNWILILHTFFTQSWQQRFLYPQHTPILYNNTQKLIH
jgi:hypothetical protein